ncbi:MAG: asparagine synthase (glutamine-hydrolyzing) [Flavobacteriales bacterium]|nr:asparagine synthase (glutamine-hydrolyzing) [Flavobacteriales bacterium]
MCGIVGIITKKNVLSENLIQKMTSTLNHRGPDSMGVFVDKNIALGHARLSIIDLSNNANQPMTSHNGRYVMVYNGEIYNYGEIATEIKQNFHVDFRTSSDSEVILEAFSHYGMSFVEKLNGMFAIAIYDKQLRELFLFRDRIGIKPLHYYNDGEHILFASEIKSIKLVASKLDVNYEAIQLFLHLGYIPAPLSIYNNLNKLEAGHFLKISGNKIEKIKYWSVNEAVSNHTITNEKEAIVKFSDLLSSSVQYQLKSDVPFGVFLSGGIDSSLITAQASAISSVPINTFSIGFTENRFNESEYAKKVANHFNTNHHEFIVSQKDAISLIDRLTDVYDEPFADSSAIPTMLVSSLAKSKVTVCLSGEGGDELFLGYGAYQWARRLDNPLVQLFRKPIASILDKTNRFHRHASYFNYPNEQLLNSHIFSQEQYYFSLQEISRMSTNAFRNQLKKYPELLVKLDEKLKQLNRPINKMEKQALFDLNLYLQDDLLTKVDRASMQYSLETRVPYLDHRIVEFAVNLSPDLKYKNHVTKFLLKEVLYQYIPKEYFDRPKQGFAIPLSTWLKTNLSYLINDYLCESIINKHGIVDYKQVELLKKRYFSGEDYLYNRIWLLIILHKFLEEKVD